MDRITENHRDKETGVRDRAKAFMISCWMFFLAAMLVVVYLSQPLSDHFVGNDYLIVSVLLYIPLFVLASLALKRVTGGRLK